MRIDKVILIDPGMSQPSTLQVINPTGSLNFTYSANYGAVAKNYTIDADKYNNIIGGDINITSKYGNVNITSDYNAVNVSAGTYNLTTTQANSAINISTGSGGFNVMTSNGDISLLSQGANIDIGVSPSGTPAGQQTQNVNIESFNTLNMSSGDMYFVSSDVISFVSNTGDIQFGTSSNGAPIIKFQDGNVLINQASSTQDYQLDIAATDSSITHPGYNGIMVNSFISNVAADITLQTSNTISGGEQCILKMGSFGANNNAATFQKYLAYQAGNVVIRLDGFSYSPGYTASGFGNDFTIYDIGRQVYWVDDNRNDTITGLGTYTTATNDTSNVVVSGTYTGNNSRTYLIQIDSIGTPNTFTWSHDGGTTFQETFVQIAAGVPITLDYGLQITFTYSTGYALNQQFIFQTRITAIVESVITPHNVPQVMYSLQPFHSYINTTTPSDIVIKTNNHEKMRITGDGAVSIQKSLPDACFDLNSNYNKVLLVNNSLTGYQINPSISQISSGGYVIVWNSQDNPSTLNFDVYGQRYLADGSRIGDNFIINNTTTANQSFPTVAGSNLSGSNHYIVAWSSYNSGLGLYKVYCQIFHNDIPIRTYDIQVDSTNPTTNNQRFPRVAGLYNGNYVITWSADDTSSGTGVYAVKGIIIDDSGNFVSSKFQISSVANLYTVNYPYPAALPDHDDHVPNGFVVAYMVAVDNDADPRYTISVRVMNPNGTPFSAEIPITTIGGNNYSSISDGLVSVAEINYAQSNFQSSNGGFVISFYRSYEADTTKYAVGDNVVGLTSGATATIQSLNPATRQITLQYISNRFLIDEEIQITSSVPNVGNIIEKIDNITFLTATTATITLDTGSKNVVAYRFDSDLTNTSDAIWSIQVNTSPLYSDTDRFSGNVNVFQYKRPLACITVDNYGTACCTWSSDSIPSVYYQLINVVDGSLIDGEQRLSSQYDGLKQRDQVVAHLQSIEGNDYGFVISWDNQALDLLQTGVYQQLIGHDHSIMNLADGNNYFKFNHQGLCGIGTATPTTQLHVKSQQSTGFYDPPNPAAITIQNTSQHIITTTGLENIYFQNGASNTIASIRAQNSVRYDDLYPQPEDLIGFYKFDESTGTQAADSSPAATYLNGGSAVYINTAAILQNFDVETCWQNGLINNCLIFNGVNNYCFIENDAQNGLNTVIEDHSVLSLSAWVNIPDGITNGASYDIVSNGGDFTISGTYLLGVKDYFNNGNMWPYVKFSFISGASVATLEVLTQIILNDRNWHHIAITVSFLSSPGNITAAIYIDGVLGFTAIDVGTISTVEHQTTKTYIGCRNPSATSTLYRGSLDELRFYKSVLTAAEIKALYNYGNPSQPPKGMIIINPNSGTNINQATVIDDTGKINGLNSKPLPFSVLTGELTAYNSNKTITGVGTLFTQELIPGDIIVLSIATGLEYTVISIESNTLLTLNQRGYTGVEASKTYQSVLRRPNIISFFDNGDNIKGHIDNYGNMMIGNARAATMLEISGTSNNTVNIPQITISNTSQENGFYDRKTAINFRGYNSANVLNPPVNLGHIEVAHEGTAADNKGIMRFFTNTGVGSSEGNALSITSRGNIGVGGNNEPLSIIHAQTTNTANTCTMILESNYNYAPGVSDSIFDERSDIAFAGYTSINETLNPNYYKRILAAVSGSNAGNTKTLKGRLDFSTIDDGNSNGIESQMCVDYNGRVGVGIIKPQSLLDVSPEIRLVNADYNYISTAVLSTGNTTITISNNIFSTFTSAQRALLVGGRVVIQNATLQNAAILSVVGNNQVIVSGDLTGWNGYQIRVYWPGLNVVGASGNGFVGVNTYTANTPLAVNGGITMSINTTTSDITLDERYYTVICDTTSSVITITLPVNGANITGRIYRIKNGSTSGNAVIVSGNGALIDGGATYTINYSFGIMGYNVFQSDGVNWWVV